MYLRKDKVVSEKIKAICDCGGEFVANYICEKTGKHYHECNKCGKVAWLDKVYPLTSYEESYNGGKRTHIEMQIEDIYCPYCDAKREISNDEIAILLFSQDWKPFICEDCGKVFYVKGEQWVTFDTEEREYIEGE